MVRNGVRMCIEDVTMHVSHERSNDTPFLRVDVNTIFTRRCKHNFCEHKAVTCVFPPCLFLLLLKQCAHITLHMYVNVYTM